jgi:hypothetical protein
MRTERDCHKGFDFDGHLLLVACQERSMVGQAIDIDIYLRRLRLEVNQLPDLASMIADEPPDIRDVWHWQWDRLMGHLSVLCEYRRANLLSAAQEREFADLMGQLDSARPELQALGMCIPEGAGTRLLAVGMTTRESIGV